jgi:chemotaxis protein MotB
MVRRIVVRPLITAVVCFFILVFFTACVSKNTHQRKIDEAASLAQTIEGLEIQYQALLEQRDRIAARGDDLEQRLAEALNRNAAFQQDLLRARADIERVEKVLSARSAEAGHAMAEMRRTIDQLEEENRILSAQVEQERQAKEARIAQMKSTFDELVDKMESEIERGEITISELQGRLTVNMVERILFASGQAEIKPDGLQVLRRVGDILKEVHDREIRVEGHTDNVPISPRLMQIFPSNWELSTARAANVVHFLQGQVGIDGERLSVSGYGPYRPVADNNTSEGRAQNRRIQIVLVPLEGLVVKALGQ